MHLAFLIAAAVGCTVLLAQVGMQLLGLGGGDDVGGHDFSGHELGADFGGDADFSGDELAGHELSDAPGHHAETNLFFGVITFKSVSAFIAFFGLTGLAAEELGIHSGALQFVLACLAGLAAGAVVVALMRLLVSFNTSGTVQLNDVVGQTARVYLSIPGGGRECGKINVEVNGRELELQAYTLGKPIPTGTSVEVVRRGEGETFEVVWV